MSIWAGTTKATLSNRVQDINNQKKKKKSGIEDKIGKMDTSVNENVS